MFASIIVNVKKVLCDGNGDEIFFAIDMIQNLKPSPEKQFCQPTTMILILILTKNIDGLLGMHCEGYTCEFKSHCVTTVKKK